MFRYSAGPLAAGHNETFAKSDHLESLVGQNNPGILPTLAVHPRHTVAGGLEDQRDLSAFVTCPLSTEVRVQSCKLSPGSCPKLTAKTSSLAKSATTQLIFLR